VSRKPVDTARYDADNLAAARLILEHPERHGAGMVQWARAVVARLAPDSIDQSKTKEEQNGIR
jgi:hypothetical protein